MPFNFRQALLIMKIFESTTLTRSPKETVIAHKPTGPEQSFRFHILNLVYPYYLGDAINTSAGLYEP